MAVYVENQEGAPLAMLRTDDMVLLSIIYVMNYLSMILADRDSLHKSSNITIHVIDFFRVVLFYTLL